MTFNDFLDMFSVFSEAAAKEIKAEYAFKIYDFDNDGELGREDLLTTAKTLSGGELEDSEMKLIVDKVMEEVDDDMDGSVSLAEFQQIVQRAADFTTQFHIRIWWAISDPGMTNLSQINLARLTNQFDLDYFIGLDPKEAATKFMMCLILTIHVPHFDYLLPIFDFLLPYSDNFLHHIH